MANWLKKLNITDEMAEVTDLIEESAEEQVLDALRTVRDKFATLTYRNKEDAELHLDAVTEIDEALEFFDGDDYEELANTILEYIYDFGDTVSASNTGEESFSQKKKLLWVKPWK